MNKKLFRNIVIFGFTVFFTHFIGSKVIHLIFPKNDLPKYVNCTFFEENANKMPKVFTNLKKYSPEEYNKVCNAFGNKKMSIENSDELVGRLSNLIVKQYPKSSDETIIKIANLSVQTFDLAQSKSEEACLKALNGVNEKILKEDELFQLMNEVVVTYNKDMALPTELQVKDELEVIFEKLVSIYGNDLKAWVDPTYVLKDKTTYCRIARDFHKEAIKNRAINTLRLRYNGDL
ncbi:hypothetical protein QJU43_07250 [Pasteurella atlantica]|uniref:hypothetical protein n=1 Tax=Pasteurellaceae TaxID=712 RepID=UPI002750D00D|nr:hypothetical protein [Pasteurella atlantica]MDP8034013.1 hypothetical protein [Pasteurella atlantica]MDP8035956.1 hypothetical protein [Pasteurella atlantica]MDP8037906.1 hypothetical protein [Pasteurella atlantica]MDP8048258.1 hypothetical protein [Pasteurella atlantica]MDP8050013.1 hypothetical protein [Pasteurella atlantica]